MKLENTFFATLLAGIVVLFGSASAHAQATIDQNKALAGSVTPGDTPGFPVTLSVPGSYKLTGNLTVPAGTTGITITVSGVTLDLNGFNIVGANTCFRENALYVVTCTQPNSSDRGVLAFSSSGNTMRNGRIAGFSIGVQAGSGSLLENLMVESNYIGVTGTLTGGAHTVIRNVRSQLNAMTGFKLRDALVQGSTAGDNGGTGFEGNTSVILDSVASGNLGAGIQGQSLVVGRSVAQDNKGGNMVQPVSLGGNLNGNTAY
ncbi:MAG: hypothetical protein H7Y62_13280 [Hyphomicrobium sp.]|nr:hypothetical protein [Hyphomicrobium sp.]